MTVADIIREAATRYGIDPETSLREAQIESSLNPMSHNASGASGLYQFMPATWAQYGHGDVYDPSANADAAMRYTRDNIATFRHTFGRDPTGPEIYLMHQQGAGGAAKLLQNPTAPAASLVGAQAIAGNAGNPNMTGADFANMWTAKYNDEPVSSLAQTATGQQPSQTAAMPSAGANNSISDTLAAAAKKLSPPHQPGIRQTAGGLVIDA